CSESSVWSILWDIYDNAPDGSDSLAMGLGPLWDALINGQRTTPALTSIFSFIEALDASHPNEATLINTIVAAQNINPSGINAFATTETNAPFPGLLPLFADITLSAPVSVRSIDDGGYYNKAGNNSFLRFTPATSGPFAISVTTSNPGGN